MPPQARRDPSRKHGRDEDETNDDMSKKRKSSDGTSMPTTATTKQSATQDIADAKARIAEIMKKQGPSSAIADKIAAAKARLAAKNAVIEQNVEQVLGYAHAEGFKTVYRHVARQAPVAV